MPPMMHDLKPCVICTRLTDHTLNDKVTCRWCMGDWMAKLMGIAITPDPPPPPLDHPDILSPLYEKFFDGLAKGTP